MTTAAKLYRYACCYCGRREPSFREQCSSCRGFDCFESISPVAAPGDPKQGIVRFTDPIKGPAFRRAPCGITWFDSLMNGGLGTSQCVLLGGGEGAGKTTLCLQIAHGWAAKGRRVLFVSAEMEAVEMQRAAERIGCAAPNMLLTEIVEVGELIRRMEAVKPTALVIDSLNRVYDQSVRGTAGEAWQMVKCLGRLAAYCGDAMIPTVFLAHLAKKASISGPRALSHDVDAVLLLGHDEKTGGRQLRVHKNRSGPEGRRDLRMTDKGLQP